MNNLFFLPLQLPIILNWSNQDGGLDWPIRKVRHWNNPSQFCDWGCYDAWCHIRLMNHCLFGHARAGWCCPLSGSQSPGVRGLSVTSRPSARLDVGGTDALRRATKWWLHFSGRHYLTRQELYIKLNSTMKVFIYRNRVSTKKCCSYCREKVRGVSERAGTDHSVPCTIHGFHCFEFDLSWKSKINEKGKIISFHSPF